MPASDVRDYRSRLVVKARNHASFDAIFATTVREALRALIERESARRLARQGGSEPDLKPAPPRRHHAT
ncbi:MAG: DUF2191 domain-containing protein [Gammaproteobacteria bacterium HGW-Gammaproteobacteria-2]|nr:MAG: DUF2191 domain-containing protein [Gammaproteobacteria bacterium HGW-Gammaproteobacteria-2]